MDKNDMAELVLAELIRRGHNAPKEVWEYVNACWPIDDTAEELADGYEESVKQNAEQSRAFTE